MTIPKIAFKALFSPTAGFGDMSTGVKWAISGFFKTANLKKRGRRGGVGAYPNLPEVALSATCKAERVCCIIDYKKNH